MIELNHYSKSFGDQPVVQIEHFRFDTGIYWLKGRNGSGKSTLLKSMAALLSFDGEIRIEGKSLHKATRLCRRMVSFGYAEPVFPDFLTGRDLVVFFQRSKGVVAGQLELLTESLDAGYFLDQKIGTYSSGMAKKLSLLLAFIGQPRWILLDEPFNALDRQAAAALGILIRDLHSQGVQLILSSHPQSQVLQADGLIQIELMDGQLNYHEKGQ